MHAPRTVRFVVPHHFVAAQPPSRRPRNNCCKPPPAAQHYTISSEAGKHGDIWSWKTDDGKLAYRMSMSLRGWITETDQTTTLGPDGRPTTIAIRGYTDCRRCDRGFQRRRKGIARWKTAVDEGSAPFGNKRYCTYGGPWLASELDVNALVKAGQQGIDLLPGGRATISIGTATEIDGPSGQRDGEAGLYHRFRLCAVAGLARRK